MENRLAAFVVVSLVLASLAQAKIAVVTAERTARFESNLFTVSEVDDKTVLVLTVKGTDENEYGKPGGRDFWLTAGQSRYDLIGKTGGLDANGKVEANYRLIFQAPKAITSFTLHWEGQPQNVQFTVSGPIHKIIK